jgi:hypothetical protein
MSHQRDSAYLFVAAWDLRGVNALTGFSGVKNDAALFTLYQLVDQPGGVLDETLVDEHQLARRIATRLVPDDNASLALEIEARSRDTRELARLALDEMNRFGATTLDAQIVTAAARSVMVGTRGRWEQAPGRAAMLGMLWASGRVKSGDSPEAWLARFELACTALTPADLRTYAGFALTADRRIAITMLPARPAQPEMELTADLIETYRRIVVDLRCSGWGDRPPLKTVLEKKYKLTPKRYVELTRALTRQRPGLMREMIRDADHVCGEWRRLSEMVGSRAKALELHRAVACGPGRMPNEKRRDKALTRIFKKFDLDPSVYRPLIRMARADVLAIPKLEAIDAKCKPRFGPAAR